MTSSSTVSFDDYGYMSIGKILWVTKNNKPVKLSCTINDLKEPTRHVGKKKIGDPYSYAILIDKSGNTIETIKFERELFTKLNRYFKPPVQIEILGRVKTNYARNRIDIIKIRPISKPLARLKVKKEEYKAVRKYVRSKKGMGLDLFEELKKALKEKLNIIRYKLDDLYDESLSVMICQAFSMGRIDTRNGKLHTCIIGGPGTGKGKLWDAAEILSPISDSCSAETTSIAGLTGAVYKSGTQFNSTEATLAMTNNGIFGIPDIDKFESKNKDKLLNVLNEVMDIGKIKTRKAYKGEYDTITSIYMDLNKISSKDQSLKGKISILKDIDLPDFTYSRLDYIVELKENLGQSVEKGKKQLLILNKPNSKLKSEIGKYCRTHDMKFERFIKILVAYVQEEYSKIETSNLRNYIANQYNKMMSPYDGRSDLSDIFEESIRRAPKAFQKFIISLTRLQLLDKTNKETVKLARQYTSKKLHLLEAIENDLKKPRGNYSPPYR